MRAKPFDASQFVATQWNTTDDKAAFGNNYLRFIESEWKRSLFTKSFYQRLSNCFGHIAHYNQHQFYETWFTCDKDRLEFLRNALAWPCWGDPTFTYSDVERAIKQQVRSRNYVALYELRAAEQLQAAEMAVLVRLETKYRPPLTQDPVTSMLPVSIGAEWPTPESVRTPIQGSLF
jgi:hypothetical protein